MEQAQGAPMEKKQQLCMICARPAPKSICDACSEKLRGEALHKKKKEDS
jgi:hypothetical protein